MPNETLSFAGGIFCSLKNRDDGTRHNVVIATSGRGVFAFVILFYAKFDSKLFEIT